MAACFTEPVKFKPISALKLIQTVARTGFCDNEATKSQGITYIGLYYVIVAEQNQLLKLDINPQSCHKYSYPMLLALTSLLTAESKFPFDR
jgi:hypothetical protein